MFKALTIPVKRDVWDIPDVSGYTERARCKYETDNYTLLYIDKSDSYYK